VAEGHFLDEKKKRGEFKARCVHMTRLISKVEGHTV